MARRFQGLQSLPHQLCGRRAVPPPPPLVAVADSDAASPALACWHVLLISTVLPRQAAAKLPAQLLLPRLLAAAFAAAAR